MSREGYNMVAPLLARAAASKAAKSSAKKAARAHKTGDNAYNARRRYQRSAERNLKKAEQTTGATSERYRNMAKQDLDKALSTYDPKTTQEFSKPIQNLANQLNVSLDTERNKLKQMKTASAEKARTSAIASSEERNIMKTDILSNRKRLITAEEMRQAEARAVFNSEIGHRIIGGLVDVWKSEATTVTADGKAKIDKRKMMKAIYDYLGVDNMADALEKIEQQIGEQLYENIDQDNYYEVVKLTIQTKVADNTLVA